MVARTKKPMNVGGIEGPPATIKKKSLLQQAKQLLERNAEKTKHKFYDLLPTAEGAVAAGASVGITWLVICLVALILMIVALVKKGPCPMSLMAIFMIVLTFVFPPAGLVLAAIGIARPATMCA